ncbi:immunogenic protein [Colletotrichum scovillei]|uniref:Immunogenic protein n=1 Tax=Colletotrichum scovillei TaxID=1209932 RepID=A0A9P7QXP6_9PEZI|nr:immunogenic protein [Colletotrichum scovillei]KAF4784560.1 immunogenic protein [Colletotrichum scovillei]KAG7044549.1 immunogenic protein [Colletotrichum scovillei]KAG7049260.1 immunogenic protein [Colletotrichum scovillei]KAG7064002.1 immunogenic protein [Colletotrichum scovillei]
MAEEQKPVEVPKETVPATTTAEAPAAETKPVETTETPAAAPVAAETATETPATTTATETPAEAAATEAAAPVEEAKKEVVPVEEGTLEHKGINFPKNFIYSKEFFWFGSDAVESKNLSSYLKSEKSTETAHHNAAWASHTGKGLLFFGDKTAPQGVINLADASEPAADGANKFHFTAKGHKHTFKAANAEDRDNWISQLKLKVAEAKELASTVTETEAYKTALEAFKPAKKEEKKEEKAVEAPATEAVAATETPAAETAAVPAAEEAVVETPKEEEVKKEEPKRRSASRKRASIFGSLLGKKEESKKEEKEETPVVPAVAETPKEETPAVPAATETPVAEVPAVEAPVTPAAETPVAAATETAAEDKPVEAAKEEKKPLPTKRNSIFGVFGKKEKKAAAAAEAETPAPAKETEVTPAAESAPVIPPVEATTPLAVDVANPGTVPVENKEVTPATNGEPRPDLKEKRKSSLPFGFGKRDKSPAKSPAHSDNEEAEKQEKTSAFSKLRATIKGRGKTEKPADKLDKTEEKPEETSAVATETPAAETSKATEEPENKPENVASSTPAPVTAAA